jgi:hypothetical protein
MNSWLLVIAAALAVGGCATAGVGTAPPDGTPHPVAENVATADGASEQPGVVVMATTPTAVQFGPGASDPVVRLLPVHRPTAVRAAVHQGMWIGAAIGALSAALMGYQSDQDVQAHPAADCDTLSCGGGGVIIGSLVFGAIGLGLGAAVGAIVGRLESP